MICNQKSLRILLILFLNLNFIIINRIFAADFEQAIACNGHIELCDKKYNEVAFLYVHNATSNANTPTSQNQDRSISAQLKDGVRAMKVPIHLDYQTMSGYYLALLKSYQENLNNKIDNKVKEVSKDYESAQNKLSDAQNKVNSIQKDIDSTNREINKIKNEIDDLQDKLLGQEEEKEPTYHEIIDLVIPEILKDFNSLRNIPATYKNEDLARAIARSAAIQQDIYDVILYKTNMPPLKEDVTPIFNTLNKYGIMQANELANKSPFTNKPIDIKNKLKNEYESQAQERAKKQYDTERERLEEANKRIQAPGSDFMERAQVNYKLLQKYGNNLDEALKNDMQKLAQILPKDSFENAATQLAQDMGASGGRLAMVLNNIDFAKKLILEKAINFNKVLDVAKQFNIDVPDFSLNTICDLVASKIISLSEQYKQQTQSQKIALKKNVDLVAISNKFNKEKLLYASNEEYIEKPLHLALSIDDISGAIKKGYQEVKEFTLSAADKAKISAEIAKLGIEIGALETKKVALVAAKTSAVGILEGIKKSIGIIDPKLDPRVAPLIAQRAVIDLALKALEKEGKEINKRVPFACHGLGKGTFYANFTDDVINTAPGYLQPALKIALTPFQRGYDIGVESLIGKKQDTGGLIPYSPCFPDPAKMQLYDLLVEIRKFLDAHPNEVFTLNMDDSMFKSYDLIASAFEKSGIMKYLHTQSKDAPWPTLGEMVKSGKRMVVFMDTGEKPWEVYPWINDLNAFDGWPSKWDYKKAEELTKEQFIPSDVILNNTDPNFRDNKYPQNKILRITHAITPLLAGSKSAASIVNQRSVLRNRLKQVAEMFNHIPNLTAMDFYELPNKDVFDVMDELNGVGKYRGNPLWTPKP